MAELNNEEQQIYVTIVLRYYNYYVSTLVQTHSYNDQTIKDFSVWFNKFIYDDDTKKLIKEHNYYEI